jgi:hypothetical protein
MATNVSSVRAGSLPPPPPPLPTLPPLGEVLVPAGGFGGVVAVTVGAGPAGVVAGAVAVAVTVGALLPAPAPAGFLSPPPQPARPAAITASPASARVAVRADRAEASRPN